MLFCWVGVAQADDDLRAERSRLEGLLLRNAEYLEKISDKEFSKRIKLISNIAIINAEIHVINQKLGEVNNEPQE